MLDPYAANSKGQGPSGRQRAIRGLWFEEVEVRKMEKNSKVVGTGDLPR